jgi:hypothetical protein
LRLSLQACLAHNVQSLLHLCHNWAIAHPKTEILRSNY